ncbi:MAG: endonuclease/exonuclease/phosphatase family protein [Thermoanaerobaculia bacterium]|nr:endonuclease/exonuclease/phosphatase family protein [Thermoanaerobaculia bacterium]
MLALALFTVLSLGCGSEPESIVEEAEAIVHRAGSPVETAGPTLNVLSWNIKGSAVKRNPDHLHEIAEVVREIDPDVVLLQEVHRHTKAAGEIDQFVLLSESLGMSGCFGESLRVGEEGSYGNAILTTGAVGPSRVHSLPGKGEPRTLLECLSEWNDLEATVMTTHLTAWDRANRRTRNLQVRAIESVVSDLEARRLVLGGDFNASLSSREMRSLRDSPHLRAVIPDYVVTHPRTGRHYDHLLVGKGWKNEEARVLRTGPSDHWPVVATLSFGGSDGRQ